MYSLDRGFVDGGIMGSSSCVLLHPADTADNTNSKKRERNLACKNLSGIERAALEEKYFREKKVKNSNSDSGNTDDLFISDENPVNFIGVFRFIQG